MKLNVLLVIAVTIGGIAGCTSSAEESVGIESSRSKESGLASNSTSREMAREICKTRPITGSRFTKKTCMTKEEWERLARQSARVVNNQSQRGVSGSADGE